MRGKYTIASSSSSQLHTRFLLLAVQCKANLQSPPPRLSYHTEATITLSYLDNASIAALLTL